MQVLRVIFLLLFFSGLIACNPFKVTDPNDARFDPDQFSFYDYDNYTERRAALKKVFPVGTSKEDVDKILLEQDGANFGSTNSRQVISYLYKPYLQTNIIITFDKKNQLLNIHAPASEKGIYPDQPDKDTILMKEFEGEKSD